MLAEEAVISFGLFVSTLIDGCTGYLVSELSGETKRFLDAAGGADPPSVLRLL